MAALAILRRDLLRMVRSPGRTALLFAVPLVMAAMFSLVFGGSGPRDIVIRVLLWNEDDGLLSRLLSGAGTSGQEGPARLEVVEVGEEGLAAMNRGEASALVHLPKDFTKDFLEGRLTRVEVVKNPAQSFLPGVVEEGVGVAASALSAASRALRPELDQIAAMSDSDRSPSLETVTGLSTAFYNRIEGARRYVFPPVIGLESVTAAAHDSSAEAVRDVSVLGYFLPGLAVMGALFLAQAATRDILRDREAGRLRHLLTAPVTLADYLAGKCLSVVVVTGLGLAFLIGLGAVAGVAWGSALAVAALIAATAIAAGGTLLLLTSLVGTERQGDALGTIVIITWSMLGGAFAPVDQIPVWLRPLSRSTLVYWATDGFNALVQHGAGLAEIALNLTVLVAAGAVLLAVGVLLLGRRIAAGGA
jgi:ABC-type multidrug transport system permease subunit